MFENTLELAENKLLLLYIFHKVPFPISKIQITEIVLENNFMNYFTLQQYITELNSSDFLMYAEKDGKNRLVITETGTKVLSLFENRISQNKIDTLEDYLKTHIEHIKKEVTITADYTIEPNNSFVVSLKAAENDFTIIDIKLTVGSNKQARNLCTKWKNNSAELYNKLIQVLVND